MVRGRDVAVLLLGLVPVELVEHNVPGGAGIVLLDNEYEAMLLELAPALVGKEGLLALPGVLVLEALEGHPVGEALPAALLLILVAKGDETVWGWGRGRVSEGGGRASETVRGAHDDDSARTDARSQTRISICRYIPQDSIIRTCMCARTPGRQDARRGRDPAPAQQTYPRARPCTP